MLLAQCEEKPTKATGRVAITKGSLKKDIFLGIFELSDGHTTTSLDWHDRELHMNS